MPFGLWTRTGSRNHELDEGPDPPRQGAILGERVAHRTSTGTFCRELCRNGGTDRFAVWVVDSGGPEGSTGSIVFARWRQCALPCGRIGTTWQMFPSAHTCLQPKRQIDQFSRFCTAHGRKSLYCIVGDHFLQNHPFSWGILTPI